MNRGGEKNGILIVDKAKGMTSHDVVDIVRERFGIKKVGHAGTLDPNATGVLVMLLGSATKASASFMSDDKEYLAVMKLGERTDSGDRDGKLISTEHVTVDERMVREAVSSFLGEIEQVPPMVSAKRVKGKRLYELARKGVFVERPPVKVTINKIEVTKIVLPYVEFDVICSKGTYVRQLADDIGERLECGAHLEELRRIRSGRFTVGKAVTVDQLKIMDMRGLDENIIRLP
ncbi:MAG: tRNA pseudouridine(55) synthase TruB [Candidatus Omnitrophica bacterium]|nr:tRNA pseudouridine(55) synthase TruB [Candidatus Omnitrophota bacterium]MDD4013349.1 tRNA pseudouridine(55) synthase TruB [Candidatus Omnitrophota bacterium]